MRKKPSLLKAVFSNNFSFGKKLKTLTAGGFSTRKEGQSVVHLQG
jgi:hypothetical protein